MRLERAHFRLELDAGELLRLDDAGAVEISCEAGRVWLTQEGNPRDVWLQRGERAVLAGSGLAVLEATQPARVRIS